MNTNTKQPYVKHSHDHDFQFFGAPTTLLASGEQTGGRFALMEHVVMPPGMASPYHVHRNEDEAFYVIEGHVRFVCDGRWIDAVPGTWVYGPREIPHGFKVVGEQPARMLLLDTPAGFEQFALELSAPLDAEPGPPDMEKLMDAAARYKVEIYGPLPDEPGGAGPEETNGGR
jgi:quercetin dioxygenase-like cupin family protein